MVNETPKVYGIKRPPPLCNVSHSNINIIKWICQCLKQSNTFAIKKVYDSPANKRPRILAQPIVKKRDSELGNA